MGKGKRKAAPPAGAGGSKDRHRRTQRSHLDPLTTLPEGLVAKPALPRSKHQTYFEFVENKEKKKKKLEFQVTQNKSPPPGFEFVPIGNPELTSACKELSREKDAMIFIVSTVTTNTLSQQVNRLGHHIRQTIVEEARSGIDSLPHSGAVTPDGKPEPIPTSQAEYHAQADAALRDLFPRIPHTDRQMIIEHAFTRRPTSKGEQPVGFSDDIPLARRVQLAVLAHIRHAHTRYDDLLREAGWQVARKAVEALCLDIIVKWRGDEETGRDQLDEILREVVVISDSEEDESDEDSTESSSLEDTDSSGLALPYGQSARPFAPYGTNVESDYLPVSLQPAPGQSLVARGKEPYTYRPSQHRRVDRKNQRGFKRYRAWEEAIMRNRDAGLLQPDSIGHILPPYGQHPEVQNPNSHFHNGMYQPEASGDGATRSDYGTAGNMPSFASRAAELQGPGFNNTSISTQPTRLSSVTNSFRDLLVPSIEPPTPGSMRPSFVRAVPPRQHDGISTRNHPVDRYGLRRSLSPPGNEARTFGGTDDSSVFSDHIPDERHRTKMTINEVPEAVYAGSSETFYPQRPATFSDTTHRYWTRFRGESRPVGMAPAERIIVNASRPGTRDNPIVMEDRGGFYERVVVPPERRQLPTGYCPDVIDMPRATIPTAYDGHRVVSSEEGAQLLRESRGKVGVEVIPLSGSLTLAPPEMRPNWPPHPESGGQQLWYSDPRARPNPHGSNQSDNRPLPVSHWFPKDLQQHHPADGSNQIEVEAQTRVFRGKRPAADDHYENTSRLRRPRSRQPDDIIVID